MDFSWAQSYPDLYKVCTLFQMAELANPIDFQYKVLKPFLQDGPKCGIVALAMCIGASTINTVQELYEFAKKRNFTYNGEMFSVKEMAILAEQYVPYGSKVEVYSGSLDNDIIRNFLLQKNNVLLVPYDTDKDNSPGFYKGHKAHWAAVSGCVLTSSEFYVLARHGKARNVAVWKLKTLAESNSQLVEFSPDRKLHDTEYKLPEGGLSGSLGLNSQCVLITLPLPIAT